MPPLENIDVQKLAVKPDATAVKPDGTTSVNNETQDLLRHIREYQQKNKLNDEQLQITINDGLHNSPYASNQNSWKRIFEPDRETDPACKEQRERPKEHTRTSEPAIPRELQRLLNPGLRSEHRQPLERQHYPELRRIEQPPEPPRQHERENSHPNGQWQHRGMYREFEAERIVKAAEFLKRNFDRLDLKKDGHVSLDEIDFALNFANDRESRRNLETLRSHYREFTGGDVGRYEPGIVRSDVEGMQARVDRQGQVEDLAAALSQGDIPLFQALDSAKNGKFDGKISKTDLSEFISETIKQSLLHTQDSVHTEQNFAIVQQMLQNWDNETSPVYQMRDGGNYITIDSVMRALGCNQDQELPINYKNITILDR